MEDVSFSSSPPTLMTGIRSKKKVILITSGITFAVLLIVGISIVIIIAIASSETPAEKAKREEEQNIAAKKSATKSNDWWAAVFETVADIFMWGFIILISLFVLRTISYLILRGTGHVDLYNDISDKLIEGREWLFGKLSIIKLIKFLFRKMKKQPALDV